MSDPANPGPIPHLGVPLGRLAGILDSQRIPYRLRDTSLTVEGAILPTTVILLPPKRAAASLGISAQVLVDTPVANGQLPASAKTPKGISRINRFSYGAALYRGSDAALHVGTRISWYAHHAKMQDTLFPLLCLAVLHGAHSLLVSFLGKASGAPLYPADEPSAWSREDLAAIAATIRDAAVTDTGEKSVSLQVPLNYFGSEKRTKHTPVVQLTLDAGAFHPYAGAGIAIRLVLPHRFRRAPACHAAAMLLNEHEMRPESISQHTGAWRTDDGLRLEYLLFVGNRFAQEPGAKTAFSIQAALSLLVKAYWAHAFLVENRLCKES